MNESETTTETTQTGPGYRLRQARIAHNMDLATIAKHLHMTVSVVIALEEDNYTDLPTRVFVRGYIRNYARLVDAPMNEILAAFDQIWPPTERPVKIQLPPRLAADTHPKHRWRQLMTWLLLLLGTLLFLLWWQGYLSQVWQQHTQSPTPASQPSEDQTLPPLSQIPPQQNQLPESAPPPLPLPETLTTAEEINHTPAPEPIPEVIEEDLAAAEDGVPHTIQPIITVRFTQACWVDIRDSSGTYQLSGNQSAGEQHQLGGEAPYQLVIGNAAAAALSIDGQPYDMKPHIRGNVARFTLITP